MENNILMARTLTLRSALRLEIKGMKRHVRSARTIAQELLELPGRPSADKVYTALNKYIVDRLGPEFDRPL